MSTTNETKDEISIGTSLVCIAAAILTILLASHFRSVVERHRHVYFVTELRDPPRWTQNTLELGPYLWVPALASSLWGFRLLITRPKAAALSWFLWSLLLTLIILSLMSWSLLTPLLRMQIGLPP